MVIDNASQFRNRIDHGRAGNVDTDEMHKIVAQQQYMHNLARLLILAKFGVRNAGRQGKFLFSDIQKGNRVRESTYAPPEPPEIRRRHPPLLPLEGSISTHEHADYRRIHQTGLTGDGL